VPALAHEWGCCYAEEEETMGNIGPGELLIIALIALLLFGAGRIADIGKGLGQGIKNFKKGLKESDDVDVDGKPRLEEGSKSASEKKEVATKEA
jgi:sec-independent protein translocase protein TatA